MIVFDVPPIPEPIGSSPIFWIVAVILVAVIAIVGLKLIRR